MAAAPTPPQRPRTPILSFLGAARTVTGSKFLIETSRSTVLIDCGLFQGFKELRTQNWQPPPVDPAVIDAVIVSHAHVDHIGYLPRLHRLGFSGPVFCTNGTADLAGIVLPDSGHLQEEEARFANKVGYSKHRPALPLYTEADADACLDLLHPIGFEEPTQITDDVCVTLRPAGHILGSSTITVELLPQRRSVLFSGDLGRPTHPLLLPPAPPGSPDVVVMESTYGGRSHDDADAVNRLADAISRTARRGGTVLIPAFAVDRTEVLLHHLRRLMCRGRIPQLPVYADSPMALRALQTYRKAVAEGAPDLQPSLRLEPDPFDTGQLHEVHDVEGSKGLANLAHPSIIVSASGMATGGRVLHHLARLLPDRRNTVILAGYQAVGTRGRRLADGDRVIKMLGSFVPVRAEVVDLAAFSVHADHRELLNWLGACDPPPEMTYLVHGEPEAATRLSDAVTGELGWPTVVPQPHERVRLA